MIKFSEVIYAFIIKQFNFVIYRVFPSRTVLH